ncbi:nuclear transport factor 2 family protein [Halorussus lipolyticus]|uniref:nuclear transport factor 2 family protein n=1 Tax=Halorussus lipolyticus TaxID=3034024 RepID=UPI0023E8AADD|nr:nuclear transport factor 2 family protein [Halorussus sp. DT80]
MNPTETVEEYYEALRRGEPLSPYFAEREDAVKFGVSERLAGYEAIAEGLREQTRTTEDWQVESRNLQIAVPESEGDSVASASVAWFTDDVALSWTELDGSRSADADPAETRHAFDTRWSGVLERELGERRVPPRGRERDDGEEPRWRFVQTHVSASHDL